MLNQVSVVIPVYNGAKFLKTSLDSIGKAIPHKDYELEVIVIDDGSTDETPRILAEYQFEKAWITDYKVIKQQNLGESAAVNRGVAESRGSYLLILSHDDTIDEEYFTELIPVLDGNQSLAAVYPDWKMIDSLGRVIAESEAQEFSLEIQYARLGCIPGPGTLIRVSPNFRIVGLRDPRYGFYSDLEQWFRIGIHGNLVRYPKSLACWRSHGGNQSTTTKATRMCKENLDLVYKFRHWQSESIREFEWGAKANAHLRVALLSLNHRLPILYGGRIHLFIAFLWVTIGFASGRKNYWTYVGLTEALLIAINPLGRYVIKTRKNLKRN